MNPLDRYAEPDPREPTAMNALTELAQEAAELRPDGALLDVTYVNGSWQLTVYIEFPDAFTHCDELFSDFGVIRVTADTLDAAAVSYTHLTLPTNREV